MSIFGDVDGLSASERATNYLNRISAVPGIEAGKRARDALLGLRPGASVLDLGCGLGVDVRRMASTVGRTGRAVGADVSRELLDRASLLPGGDLVEWCVADACRLPYSDHDFDGVRIERMLEHLADPAAAVGEALRVTRPGGVVCLCEPDWGTLVVGGLEQGYSETVRDVMSQTVRNPYVGRELAALVHGARRARSVELYAEVVTVEGGDTIASLAPTSSTLPDAADGDLRGMEGRDGLIAMLTMVTVVARC